MWAKRVDPNQREIVDALRRIGCSVFLSHTIGRGFPDLVVGRHGHTFLVEVKTEDGDLKPSQKDFISTWRGSKVRIVRTVEEAIAAVS